MASRGAERPFTAGGRALAAQAVRPDPRPPRGAVQRR
jgi:hypothetical protein